MTGTNVAPTYAIHGVGDAPPRSPGCEKKVKVYRYIEGAGWNWVDSKLATELCPFLPSFLVLLLRVVCSAGVD